MCKVKTANGETDTYTYFVSLYLPNMVCIPQVRVTQVVLFDADVLIATCVGSLGVGVLSLRKNYQTYNEENNTANEKLSVLVTQNTDKGTNYHQAYTHPFYRITLITHIFRSALVDYGRRIIDILKGAVNHNGKEPVFVLA